MRALLQLLHTLAFLQRKQVVYRLWYPIKRKLYPLFYKSLSYRGDSCFQSGKTINFLHAHPADEFYPSTLGFQFLNKEQHFQKSIDWGFMEHGLLWNYHLHYFNWLAAKHISVEDKWLSIQSFLEARLNNRLQLRPYPASLRIRNWIKFSLENHITDNRFLQQIQHDAQIIFQFQEFHIGANHLLENYISLYWYNLFIQNKNEIAKWRRKLLAELKHQLLQDGLHYEGSPMYHISILCSLLETYAIAQLAGDDVLLKEIAAPIKKMLSWLQQFIYPDGSYAQVGDSSKEEVISSLACIDYAQRMGLLNNCDLTPSSSFLKFSLDNFQLLVKGAISYPPYQQGHRHADDLAIWLWCDGVEIITDTGISTYEKNERRLIERSTPAHNTVTVNGENNLDVWASFRAGKRPFVSIMEHSGDSISLTLDVRRPINYRHTRKVWNKGDKLYFCDTVICPVAEECFLSYHLHPTVIIKKITPIKYLLNGIILELEGCEASTLESYEYAAGFSKLIPAFFIKLPLSNSPVKTILYRVDADRHHSGRQA